MSHSSLYLTNLYNDLITNTPQTITMDIPSEVGQGQISQTKIKHGVILSDWKMCRVLLVENICKSFSA